MVGGVTNDKVETRSRNRERDYGVISKQDKLLDKKQVVMEYAVRLMVLSLIIPPRNRALSQIKRF